MTAEPRPASLAVLIDADNTSPRYAHAIFEEIAKFGEANVRRIYGDFSGTRLSGWDKAIQSLAILQHQQRNNTTGKNAADIALVIDAIDLMHKGKLDGFCLISSDSDFTRLAQRLREDGLKVYGFGERKTPEAFRSACNRFIYVENLLSSDGPTEMKQQSRADAKVKPKSKVEARKQESHDTGGAAAGKVAQSVPNRTDEELPTRPYTAAVPLILKAMKQLEDDDGWYHLAEIGSVLSKLYPDFDSRTYGCAKLSELVIRTGQLQIKKTAAKGSLVARKPLK
jgi:uncharacterized LabA/DUF88 family protein